MVVLLLLLLQLGVHPRPAAAAGGLKLREVLDGGPRHNPPVDESAHEQLLPRGLVHLKVGEKSV